MSKFREFYEKQGVDYDAFLQRMMNKEALVEKYIGIFMTDTTYIELEQAMEVQDFDTVGFKAHTLKGIALNLNFEKLGILCRNMISSVRSGEVQELASQFSQIKEEYAYIVEELGGGNHE